MQFILESHEAEFLRGILGSVVEFGDKAIKSKNMPEGLKAHAQSLGTDSRTLLAMFGWNKRLGEYAIKTKEE